MQYVHTAENCVLADKLPLTWISLDAEDNSSKHSSLPLHLIFLPLLKMYRMYQWCFFPVEGESSLIRNLPGLSKPVFKARVWLSERWAACRAGNLRNKGFYGMSDPQV